MKCNAIFEGGGAKGVAHIGALRAIEEYKLIIDKVAGTSAGSIIATMIALGYKSRNLYHPENTPEDNQLPKSLLGIIIDSKKTCYIILLKLFLLFAIPFAIISCFIGVINTITCLCYFIAAYPLLYGIFFLSKKTTRKFKTRLILRALFGSIIIALISFTLLLVIVPATFLFWGFGLVSTDGIERWLETVISKSPAFEKRKNKKIKAKELTFSQLYEITGVHLKLISSDIGTRELTVFSHENDKTKDMTIIDGVISSISIPLLFKCKKIEFGASTYQLVDGGMLSNFPAWSYRKHILLDNLKHTIGIKLSPCTQNKKDIDNPLTYIANIAITALWGASSIENISVKGLALVNINTGDIGTLSFSLSDEKFNGLYTQAYEQTKESLINNYSIFPHGICESWLENISNEFINTYSTLMEPFKSVGSTEISLNYPKRRSCLISSIDNTLNISKIVYHFNMDKDLDRHLEFDDSEGVSGLCLTEGIPFIYLPETEKIYQTPNNIIFKYINKDLLKMSENRQLIIKNDIKVIFTIPIFNMEELCEKSIISDDYKNNNNVQKIDFSLIKKHKITPKAVWAIDLPVHFLYSEEGAAIEDFYTLEFHGGLLSLFTYIASKAISDVSGSIFTKKEKEY